MGGRADRRRPAPGHRVTAPQLPYSGTALARATSGALSRPTDGSGRNPGLERLMARALAEGEYDCAALLAWLARVPT